MDLLARREHSRQELQQKLMTRLRRESAETEVPQSEITKPLEILEQVLDQLEADKLLSDVRFAESFVNARSHRGYGPLYIRHQLRQKQLDDALLQNSLATVEQEQWLQQLLNLISRKIGEQPIPNPLSKEFQRLQRFVLARGFTATQWHEARKGWEEHLRSRNRD